MPDVRVLADSLNIDSGDRCTTLLLTRFPYTLLQEPATHRLMRQDSTGEPLDEVLAGDINPFADVTSRSSASTRAIPVAKIIERVKADPFIPTFSKHQKGMQGLLDNDVAFQEDCAGVYNRAMQEAIHRAEILHSKGAHKQHVNDLLKPFLRIPILITATEWENFFFLRTEAPCRHEFREIAHEMRQAITLSVPQRLKPGEWHMPFSDQMHANVTLDQKLHVAAARCARLSYASHDGVFSLERDLELAGLLIADHHKGPFEHSLMALSAKHVINTRNFKGFYSHRAHLEDSVPVLT